MDVAIKNDARPPPLLLRRFPTDCAHTPPMLASHLNDYGNNPPCPETKTRPRAPLASPPNDYAKYYMRRLTNSPMVPIGGAPPSRFPFEVWSPYGAFRARRAPYLEFPTCASPYWGSPERYSPYWESPQVPRHSGIRPKGPLHAPGTLAVNDPVVR